MSGEYPGALWIGTVNFGYPGPGRNGEKVQAIITHIAEGTRAGVISWFQNPLSSSSSTYFICKDGAVLQFVKEADAPWTNGVDYTRGYNAYRSNLSIPWLKDCWDRRVSPNLKTLTIELEGYTNTPLPEAQVKSWIALHQYLVAKWGVPVDPNNLTGHYQIDAVNRPNCPGNGVPWSSLFSGLQQPTIDATKVGEYSHWAGLRVKNGEDPRDRSAFVDYLKAVGKDYRYPFEYGWPVTGG